jgi:hypothetical protein
MGIMEGKRYINKIRKRWISSRLLSALFNAASIAVLNFFVWSEFAQVSFWWIPGIFIPIATGLVIRSGILNLSLNEVCRLLNQNYPQLEESSDLFLRAENTLNTLEKLQIRKIEAELSILEAPASIYRRLKISVLIFIVSLIISLILNRFDLLNKIDIAQIAGKSSNLPEQKETLLPGIESLSLKISPPAYTQKPSRSQKQFSAKLEEGSVLSWEIETDRPVKNMEFIFNDKQSIGLRVLNTEKTRWALIKKIDSSGFYQLKMDGKLSELYKLEVIKDQAALIRIISPAQYSSIDIGEPKKTVLNLQITDDYGIEDAFISATISRGKGEGVQFKDQKVSLATSFSGARQYQFMKTLDLEAMGMEPGDELYFFINAKDSKKQESRSDVYIVTIQDTAQLISMDGMLSGVNLVPEYFRSQRQIIIDTEKLIKERSHISETEFKNRSNNLGIDQKLLRLRYGKFLGEETDEEIGEDHADHAEDEAADFGNAEKMLDAYAHKHDIAEDATFFEPELKAQLKATLAEMWSAELRLRTYKPEEALPFEYKALRLLKDLQQKSRVYVAKTAFKAPQIKAEKRLSGELDKIIQPLAERKSTKTEERQNSVKRATAVLARLKNGDKLSDQENTTLKDSGTLLAEKASAEPAEFLSALTALRRIMNTDSKAKPADILSVEAAYQKILKDELKLPQAKRTGPGTALSKEYFNNLNRNRP